MGMQTFFDLMAMQFVCLQCGDFYYLFTGGREAPPCKYRIKIPTLQVIKQIALPSGQKNVCLLIRLKDFSERSFNQFFKSLLIRRWVYLAAVVVFLFSRVVRMGSARMVGASHF